MNGFHTTIYKKRQRLALLLTVVLMAISKVTAQSFHETPLLDALQTISRNHSDYSIDILSDGLDGLRTTAQVKNLPAPDAVKRICKGLPVKVKVRGQHITVQMKKRALPKVATVDLSGEVEDGFLKIPLVDAKVSVMTADSAMIDDSLRIIRFYNGQGRLVRAHFGTKVRTGRDYLVHAQLKGYDDVWKQVSIGRTATEDVDVGALQMRKMRSMNLDEVVVTATRVKFYYRGDTLIYDATAFQLPEGSMLDDLIRQLPGVTMNNNGEIFVNGRKVDELLLGSRSFFGGNKKVLMENLPYYTVKNLKVYEKQSDKSKALGYEVEPRSYVMDVNLKDEYSQGFISNMEGAVGTERRWLARGFLLGFTNRLRFTLLANTNNVNESRHIGESDQWSPARMPKSMITTRSVASELNYHSEGDKVKETIRAEYTSTTDEQAMSQYREQFLEGCTPTSFTESFNRSGVRKLTLHNDLTLTKPTWFYLETDFNYSRRNGAFNSAFDEWNDSLTVSQRTVGMNEGKAWSAQVNAQGAIKIGNKNRHVSYYVVASHRNDKSEEANRYETKGTLSSLRHNSNDLFNRTTWALANMGYNFTVGKDVNLGFGNEFYIRSQHTHDYLYHPDTLLLPSQKDMMAAITDLNNSYDSRDRDWSNKLTIRLNKPTSYTHPDFHVKVHYEKWAIQLALPVQNEYLHYQRGAIDTIARQTVFLPNVSFNYRNVWKDGRRDLKLSILSTQDRTLLIDRVNFHDDSRPLIVKLGNPNLKPEAHTKINAEFFDKTSKRKGLYYLSAAFDYHHRNISQSLAYNPVTGVYTYKPMNVSGAYTAHSNFSTDHSIGEKRYWSWHVNAGVDWNHSKDHAMLIGMTESQVNTVNTLSLNSGGHIRFNKNTLNVRAVGYIYWKHSEGQIMGFNTLNALDYQYGFEAYYTTPAIWGKKMGGLTLAADGMVYSRRGYGSREFNTDDIVINASISQPFVKGKLILRLEAFDILHQLSDTQYSINAQGRIETWYRSLPHYLMLHLVYHWNKNPKR